ncbi:MAG: PQQ-like beta-propeller repeat protein, partial [Candidatus Aureabacteria bacterium]|nr:PQQ-like beta-propeller repeat protein [Candidatus Auribacterota bacterium]
MKIHRIVSACGVCLVAAACVCAQPMAGSWPMFRHDAQHTARGDVTGSLDGALAWSYAIGTVIESSAAVSSDGGVYFGAHSNRLYRINADGSGLTSYLTAGDVTSSPAIDAA